MKVEWVLFVKYKYKLNAFFLCLVTHDVYFQIFDLHLRPLNHIFLLLWYHGTKKYSVIYVFGEEKKHNKYIFTQLKHVEQSVELFLLTFTDVVNKYEQIS